MTEHYWPMTHNTSAFTPRNQAQTSWDMDRVATFDVESHDWTQPIAVGLYTPDSAYQEWTDTDEEGDPISALVDEIMRPKYRNFRFTAHNGGGYDFGFIISELMDREHEWDMMTKGNGDVFYMEIRDRHGKPRYLQDSMALMPRGLDSLTEAFAPDHAKLDFDATDLPASYGLLGADEQAELSKYLKRDCTALRRVLEEFTGIVRELTGGKCGPQLTVGSTTVAAYQTAFMADEDIPLKGIVSSDNGAAGTQNPENCFREAYFGGRTEVYKMAAPESEGPFYHYDVNSLYPAAYTESSLPAGEIYEWNSPDTDRLLDEMTEYGGAVKITGNVPDDTDLPVLPAYLETEASNPPKVVFPTGPISGWYMLREVRYAREIGALEDVEVERTVAAHNYRPFENYGESLYTLKKDIDKDENPGKYKVVKFLLNSFYGKFGMDRKQSQVVRRDTEELEGYPPEGMTTIGDGQSEIELSDRGVFEEEDRAEAAYILPRIASAITAEARILMHKWFRRVKAEGGRIWYCDTDSIVTDVELPDKWVNDELGGMDLEHTVEEAYFLRPKTYAERFQDGETLIKGKGMRDIAESNAYSDAVEFGDFRAAFEDSDPGRIATEWEGVRGLKSTLKETPTEGVKTDEFSRSLGGFDDKRTHSSDGLDSSPVNTEEVTADRVNRQAAARRARKRLEVAETAWEEQTTSDKTAGFDAQAQLDSSLTVAENKSALWENRKEEAKDRGMFQES